MLGSADQYLGQLICGRYVWSVVAVLGTIDHYEGHLVEDIQTC